MKCFRDWLAEEIKVVTLRVRVWIEMLYTGPTRGGGDVTLRVRVWIEIFLISSSVALSAVTLRVRVWIEIDTAIGIRHNAPCHPPCEGVD